MNVHCSTAHARIAPGAYGLVAVAGALLGAGWDYLHVVSHTLVYSVGLGRQPLWVPLQFALVYVVGVTGFAAFGTPSPERRSRYFVLWEVVWVTLVYATTAALHRYEFVVLGIAASVLIYRGGTIVDVVRRNPLPAVALIVLGPVVESLLISAGVFRYQEASLGNLPVWLPFLYANAVPFGLRLTEAALAFGRRRERAR